MKTNKQKKQELPENQTVWKSDNHEVIKEETFIQTSWRGRDRQPEQGGEDVWQGGSWRTKARKAAAARVGGPTFVCR